MKSETPLSKLVMVYGSAAVAITWPVVLAPWRLLPGAERSDLWNSLWSMWFVQRQVWEGSSPLRTELLGHPGGGELVVADPFAALAGLLLVPALGLPLAYNLLVFVRSILAAWAAHRLAEALAPERGPVTAAWVAGLGFQTAPVLVSALHNGTSEAFSAAWLPLALHAALLSLRRGSWWWALLTGLATAASLWASWYLGACTLLGLFALIAAGEGSASAAPRFRRLLPALGLGVLLALPWAWLQLRSTGAGSLVGIKDAAELALLRRTTGAADPLGFLMPGDFRSPDFRLISRYGEDFVHCTYLGWALLVGALLALRRSCARRHAWLLLAAASGLVLSMGPVLVRGGHALLLAGDRVVPLPYLLLESLPGFSGLSLVYRLAMLPALGVALLASEGFGRMRVRWAWIPTVAAVLVFLEARMVAPVQGLPSHSSAELDRSLQLLRDAPGGAVMNFPVAGGRRYLYEQTAHEKPVTGGLNFPNNRASMRVWKIAVELAGSEPQRFVEGVVDAACAEGVGYLVVHRDPLARPDHHQRAVRALEERLPTLGGEGALRIIELCPDSVPKGR